MVKFTLNFVAHIHSRLTAFFPGQPV